MGVKLPRNFYVTSKIFALTLFLVCNTSQSFAQQASQTIILRRLAHMAFEFSKIAQGNNSNYYKQSTIPGLEELAISLVNLGLRDLENLTHDEAIDLQSIIPDPNHQIEIYYFFSLGSEHCRAMSPDVERLWRLTRFDPRVVFKGVLVGDSDQDWMQSFKDYTGISFPIFLADESSASFEVRSVPALVFVSPGTSKAYLVEGQYGFSQIFQVARTVQGYEPNIHEPRVQSILQTAIGEKENSKSDLQLISSSSLTLPVQQKASVTDSNSIRW